MKLDKAIIELGIMAEKKMQDAETEEEYAFLFGHVNMAAALAQAIHHTEGAIHISMDYEDAHKSYQEAKAEHEEDEEECPFKQISMEELFPLLFEALKSATEKKSTPKKPSTTKKSTKKE